MFTCVYTSCTYNIKDMKCDISKTNAKISRWVFDENALANDGDNTLSWAKPIVLWNFAGVLCTSWSLQSHYRYDERRLGRIAIKTVTWLVFPGRGKRCLRKAILCEIANFTPKELDNKKTKSKQRKWLTFPLGGGEANHWLKGSNAPVCNHLLPLPLPDATGLAAAVNPRIRELSWKVHLSVWESNKSLEYQLQVHVRVQGVKA